MASPDTDQPNGIVLPSRWALATQGDSQALGELADSYWYCIYAWWRRSGLAAVEAASATQAGFTRWMRIRPPGVGDSGVGLMREWLPGRLAELAAEGWELEEEPAIAIEAAWAEMRYADEPEGELGAIFHRRWALTVLEFTMQALRAEYAARGLEALFVEAVPFVGFEGGDDEHYVAAAERAGLTAGAMHKAVFDFRTHHHDLLRSIVADTVADPEDVNSEITALLCACELPGAAEASPAPLPTAIRTFKPDELLARAMNTVQMTSGGPGKWKPPTDLEAARLFPQYEMYGLVGRGAMGAVYRARQVALDREVAIKLLPLEVSADRAFADRFVREARAMAKLSHPNLIGVFNFGTTSEGHLFFVMEYVEGANLSQMIRESGLTPEQVLVIAGQVCTALAYAHGKGVIHRDIKPANVMVNTEGVVKVADFGLARLAGADPTQYGQTLTGTIMGTQEYMSPEQKRGMAVDHRADIFSIGMMLYEMLCKEPPQGTYEPPSQRVGCDARIDAIVLKAIHRTPEGRYQSAAEMEAALAAARTPLPADPQRRVPPMNAGGNQPAYVTPPEKSSVGLIAALLLMALLVGGAVYFLNGNKKPGGKSVAQTASVQPSGAQATTTAAEFFGPPIPADFKLSEAAPANGEATAITPKEASPDPTEPTASPATPAPKTAMEKWLDDLEKTQQAAFEKQVTKPFEAGLEELRKSYLAALDAGQAKAATTGKLDAALIWNDERRAFEETGVVELDDDSTPKPLLPLRAEYRQRLAQLETERANHAKSVLASYDAILAKTIIVLTQRDRIPDALLLKQKREEIAKSRIERPVSKATVKPFATKDRPFVNTLGMKFVPVPITGGPTGGQRVLFSVWETRLQDYEVFATETGLKWEKAKEPLLPVGGLYWGDAQAFCAWLTDRERKAGKLATNEIYRLPTDHEWSCAVGIGEQEDAAKLPKEKNSKIPETYPWGSAWPPPKDAGNYAGKEMEQALAAGKYNWVKQVLSDYQDAFVERAPVGSFAANGFGLYDLGGNVYEWCEDWYDSTQQNRTLRDGAWDASTRALLASAKRRNPDLNARLGTAGVRVVLSAAPAAGPTPPEPAGQWENLLAKLTPEIVAQTGHGWRLEKGALYSPEARFKILPLPGRFAGTSYEMSVKLRNLAPKEVFHFILPVGDRMTGFDLDGFRGSYTGLNMVDGKQTDRLPGAIEGRQVKDSRPHDFKVTVRLEGANAKITTTLDTHPLYEWTGPIMALSQNSNWGAAPPGALAFGTLAADWEVSEVKVRRLEPSKPAAVPAPGTPAPMTAMAANAREAMQWLLAKGGSCKIAKGTAEADVLTERDLPVGNFEILGLSIDRRQWKATPPTHADMRIFRGIKSLRTFWAYTPDLGDAAFAFLAGNAELTTVHIHTDSDDLTDRVLQHLAASRKLTDITVLYAKNFTGNDLEKMPWLPVLTKADFHGSGISDKGLKEILGATALTDLNLELCKGFTNTGLAKLAALTKLQTLNVRDTGVTPAAIEAFKKAVPKCVVTH